MIRTGLLGLTNSSLVMLVLQCYFTSVFFSEICLRLYDILC